MSVVGRAQDDELYEGCEDAPVRTVAGGVVLRRRRGGARRCGPDASCPRAPRARASDDRPRRGRGGGGGGGGGGGAGDGGRAVGRRGVERCYWRRRGRQPATRTFDARPALPAQLARRRRARQRQRQPPPQGISVIEIMGPGSSSGGAARSWRAPSVVVSDYSDDVPACFASFACDEDAAAAAASASDDASASTCATSVCALRTPERKASDCSTCSTLSGADDDRPADALLQPLRSCRTKLDQASGALASDSGAAVTTRRPSDASPDRLTPDRRSPAAAARPPPFRLRAVRPSTNLRLPMLGTKDISLTDFSKHPSPWLYRTLIV
ncbi:Uncharacterized protein GBIM_19874 [Gryllus bimaculatus]|nr:Uncharacterized protein GBIM_19874 [Gryllus bimaculatus]